MAWELTLPQTAQKTRRGLIAGICHKSRRGSALSCVPPTIITHTGSPSRVVVIVAAMATALTTTAGIAVAHPRHPGPAGGTHKGSAPDLLILVCMKLAKAVKTRCRQPGRGTLAEDLCALVTD
jgi:hypothetical protein